MYAYVMFCIADEEYRAEIREFSSLARYILPEPYDSVPDTYENGNFILFAWHASSDPHGVRRRINPGIVSHPQKGALFASGYLAEGLIDQRSRSTSGFERGPEPAGVFKLLSASDGRVTLADSLGGVSANAWISADGDAAHCWSSQPPAIPTFVAKNRSGFCVVGNRPRLVHAASVLSLGYSVDPSYLQRYIVSGFAFDSRTPYEGVTAVPPNRSVTVRDAKPEIEAYPLGQAPAIPGDRPLEEKAAEVAALLRGACWPARAIGRSNLFLSGGKDSRTIACTLRGTTDLSSFTIGDVNVGEGFAAKQVADRLGGTFAVRPQPVIADPIKALAVSNRNTDGLGINFAHQVAFRPDFEFLEGLPSYHGHGHLLRGGFARTMAGDRSTLDRMLYGAFQSPFVTEEAAQNIRRSIGAWKEDRQSSFRDGRDVLVYAQMDFRLGLFTAPSSLDLTSRTMMVYPLLDERVCRYATGMTAFDRISERVLFGALELLARDLTELPLFGEIWRFDRSPEKTEFSDSQHNFQRGYELRRPLESTKLSEINVDRAAFAHDADRGRHMLKENFASLILQSSRAGELRKIIRADVMAEIESFAAKNRYTDSFQTLDRNAQFNMNSFIKRATVGASLYDMRW